MGGIILKYKVLKVLSIVIFAMAFSLACFSNNNPILEVKKTYQEIEEKVTNGELIDTRVNIIANQSLSEKVARNLDYSGSIYDFFWDTNGRNLRKVKILSSSSSVVQEEEYLFYENGSLAFYFYKSSKPIDNKVLSQERYYFSNNNLIRYIIDEKIIDNNFPEKILKMCNAKLEKAKTLRNILKMILGH